MLILPNDQIEILQSLVRVAERLRADHKPDELRWIRQQFQYMTSEHSRNLMRHILTELNAAEETALQQCVTVV